MCYLWDAVENVLTGTTGVIRPSVGQMSGPALFSFAIV
jgi:hypothetical protein